NHKEIEKLKFYSSLMTTWLKRPDLLERKLTLLKQLPIAKAYLGALSKVELKAIGFLKKGKNLILLKKQSN
ncbi:MAG: hypothetical protein OXC37_05330, partial [Bdellovibrionaceae bacterium]|nr:hypothetical protein [Pseudobdellovibrionaceae bacterium]